MAHVNPGPALPWGASADAPASRDGQGADPDGSDLQACSIEQLGFKVGDRVEVLWVIEAEGEQPFKRWWGALILQPNTEPATTSGAEAAAAAEDDAAAAAAAGPVYRLKYDAFGDDFAEEEVAAVQLLSDHRLLDLAHGELMPWRAEGAAYEPPESDDESEEVDDMAGSVSLAQLAASISDADVAAADAGLLSGLAAYPPSQQRRMAAGYRDFLDNFKAFVAAKAELAPGPGEAVLITADDVADFTAMMETRRRQQR